MKKLFLLSLAAILFAACQNKVTERYTTSSPEINVAKTLINDYHDGNWESWMTHYADTATIYHNNWETGITPSEHATNLKDNLTNISSYHFDEEDGMFYEAVFNDGGDTFVYFWGNWKGTVAANNREIEFPVHLAFRFTDGKITDEWGFYNLTEVMEALNEIEASSIEEETE